MTRDRDHRLTEEKARIEKLAQGVDRTLPSDPAAAEPFAREEYTLLLEAESIGGKRLHKGHPLHNIGVAIHAKQPEEARTYFHAAHVEDVRTNGTEDRVSTRAECCSSSTGSRWLIWNSSPGEQDQVVPLEATRLVAERLPNANLVTDPETDHTVRAPFRRHDEVVESFLGEGD